MKKIDPKLYGHFSDDGKQFIITDPRTPTPWVNYMWNEKYCGLMSHCGGGFSYFISPRDNRLTRFRYNSLPWDRPGRYVYLKEGADYWSITWSPTTSKKYSFYECRHNLGFSTITTEYKKIRSSITYFVPVNENCEIWKVSLINKSSKVRKLDVFSYVELCLGNALNDLINQCNDKHFSLVTFNKNLDAIFATRKYWVTNKGVSVAQPNQEWPYFLFFSSSLKTKSFDGSKDDFIGKWNSEENPIAIQNGFCSNSEITYGDPCAALHSSITLNPNDCIEFNIIIGIVEKSEKNTNQPINEKSKSFKLASNIINKYKKIGNSTHSLDELKSYWNKYVMQNFVISPDKQFNTYFNFWNKYQNAVTFDMARNSGYYHGGLLFGTGIRDQLQDSWGPIIHEPTKVKNRIKEVLSYQFIDGSTLHNFFKISGIGEKTGHSDTQLWIPFGIINYLKETGDIDFLKENVRFYNESKIKINNSVENHLNLALDFSIKNLTKRFLPKFGPGDWNDTLDYVGRGGKGETIWGAAFLCYILKETIELYNFLKIDKKKNYYQGIFDKIAKSVNDFAWDGDWYVRGFKDNGLAIGSKKCKEGKIFLEPQSWAIISGISSDKSIKNNENRTDKIIKSVEKYLLNPEGFQILTPAYKIVDDSIGLATRCVPGKKENAAVFNHPNSWFILAEILSGRSDFAYSIFKKMLPDNISNNDQENYKTEPYVFSEYVTSREHETHGEASHSWLTGTAVWMYRIASDYILGIKPTFEGLVIDPKIPSNWDKVKIVREFRNRTYAIEILNEKKNYSKISSILVDNELYDKSLLPLKKEGSIINIKIILD